ncbi:MAG TPA: ABC transporter substrate-binding protein [Methylomirabilota bacterium]|jgi:peptide/nickel transport system substrate-binding protein
MDRRDFLSRASFALAAGLASATATAPAAAATAAPTTTKRDLVIAQAFDLTSLDPHASTLASDWRIAFNVFDTLVRRHPDGTLHPGLASTWKRTAPTTWQLTLRSDVRWHDGTRFTSVDAKYSLDRTYDPTVKAARLLGAWWTQAIERTEAPDPATLIIHTRWPDLLMPARLACCAGAVVPRAYIDRVGFKAFNERPIGSGPLRFASRSKGDQCLLDANPDYWGGRIDVDRVVFQSVPDPERRVDLLLRGAADLIMPLPPEHGPRVASDPSTRVAGVLYAGLYVLAVNVWVAPLNDPTIRQALSLAIDRETIVKELWRGRGVVPSGPIPRGDGLHDPSRPALPYDPGAARARLRRAGYRGEAIHFETTAGMIANDRLMAEAIAEMWEDVGVKVVLDVIDTETRHRKNRQQAFKGLWWSDPTSIIRDPDGMMGRLLSPGQPHDYWRHDEFDRLAVAARSSGDEGARAEAYRKMTAIFLEQNPWIVVLQPIEDYGLRRYVEFTPNPDQQLELRRFNFRMRRA